MKLIYKALLILFILILLVSVPFLLMMIIGSDAPAFLQPVSGGTIKEQSWIAFSGAYTGAIIGAVGAVTIMFITIRENKKEKIESRKYTDFLYIRDVIECYIAKIDSWSPKSYIDELSNVFDGEKNHVWRDIDEMNNKCQEIYLEYGRLRRALSQSINNITQDCYHSICNCCDDIFEWYVQFIGFRKLVIHHCQSIDPDGDMPADRLLKELSVAMMKAAKDAQSVGEGSPKSPYSFFDWIAGYRSIEKYKEINDADINILKSIVLEYYTSYNRIPGEIKKEMESLLGNLRNQQFA